MGQALQIVHPLFHITLSGNFPICKCVQYLLMLQVINAWETELKQHFLFFVTGSRRLPQPHTEVLRIELPFVAFDVKDHTIMLSRLPQVNYATLCSCILWCAAAGELLMMMMMLLCNFLSHACKTWLVELLTHLKTDPRSINQSISFSRQDSSEESTVNSWGTNICVTLRTANSSLPEGAL